MGERTVSARVLKALAYYALEHVSPYDPVKIHHPANKGWSSKTIGEALDAGLLTCGKDGWHVLTDAGRAALGANSPQDHSREDGARHE